MERAASDKSTLLLIIPYAMWMMSKQSQLEIFQDPHDAIRIARYDDAANYRPLKTAPNLRHGWRLTLTDLAEICLALDFLYPAAVGTALAFLREELIPSTCVRHLPVKAACMPS